MGLLGLPWDYWDYYGISMGLPWDYWDYHGIMVETAQDYGQCSTPRELAMFFGSNWNDLAIDTLLHTLILALYSCSHCSPLLKHTHTHTIF